jgi:hypothetical protein
MRADHHHRARHVLEVDDAVGVDDRLVVEGDAGRAGGGGAGGDDDLVGGDLAAAPAAVVDLDRVGTDEVGVAADDGDAVAAELVADDVALPADHVGGPAGQVGHRDFVLDPVRLTVDLPLVDAGEIENGLPERLGRDRSRLDADSADHGRALDDRYPPV